MPMNRVTKYQWILIGASLTFDATLISLPNQIIQTARSDAWLSYLLALGVIFFSTYLLLKAVGRFPGKSGLEAIGHRYPVLGRMVISAYMLLFFFILARDLRMVVDFMKVALLPNTPAWIITGMVLATVIVIAKGGLQVFARMTELWMPALLLLIFVMPLIMFRDFRYEYLPPVFPGGMLPVMQGAWFLLPYFGEVLGLALFARSDGKAWKLAAAPLLLGTGTLLLMHYETILTLGTELPTITLFPTYELVRHIRLTDFLDRFDLILVGLWLPTMITKITYSLYLLSKAMTVMVPSVNRTGVVAPIALLAAVWSFWFFENTIIVFQFNEVWPVFGILFMVALPATLFLFLRPKRQERENPAPEA